MSVRGPSLCQRLYPSCALEDVIIALEAVPICVRGYNQMACDMHTCTCTCDMLLHAHGHDHMHAHAHVHVSTGVLAWPQLQAPAAAARLHGIPLPHRARQDPRRVDRTVVPPSRCPGPLAPWLSRHLAALRTRAEGAAQPLTGPKRVQPSGPAEVAISHPVASDT